MLRFPLILLVPIALFAASPAQATDLSGKISVSKKFMEQLAERVENSEAGKKPGYWSEPNGVKPVASPHIDFSSDFGVVLVREDGGEPRADGVKSVNVLTGGLEKNVVVIRPKSRIKFVMKSPYDHELYALKGTVPKHNFKPQKQGSRTFRPIDFTSAGIFEVKCKLFPHFQAWVVVEPAHHVVKVESSGSYKVEDLKPGKYRIKVFFDGKWIHEKEFEVDGRKQELNVELKNLDGKKKGTGKKKDEEKKPEAEKADRKKD